MKAKAITTRTVRAVDTSTINPFDRGFNVALRWRGYALNTSLLTFNFNKVTSTNGGVNITTTAVALRACTLADFPTQTQAELTIINVTAFYCMNADVNFTSVPHGTTTSSYLNVMVNKCSGASCGNSTTVVSTYVDFLYITADYDHTHQTEKVKYTVNLDTEVVLDPSGIFYYGFRLQEQKVLDTSGAMTNEFIKVEKFNEGYHYIEGETPMILAKFILDDYKVTWQQYYEYQPNIVSQQVVIGDPLPTGTTMRNCSGIYT